MSRFGIRIGAVWLGLDGWGYDSSDRNYDSGKWDYDLGDWDHSRSLEFWITINGLTTTTTTSQRFLGWCQWRESKCELMGGMSFT